MGTRIMCNYGMNILQHLIFYGEYLLYEIIAFHPLPHRRYPITISLYPIGANTPPPYNAVPAVAL
jgi:hypothetical protein